MAITAAVVAVTTRAASTEASVDQAPRPTLAGATPAPAVEAPRPRGPLRGGTRFDPIIPARGTGSFVGAGPAGPPDPAADLTYTVEVEQGLPYAAGDVATQVGAVLADDRGWTGALGTTFSRVTATGDLAVRLASPTTTDVLCAPLQTRGQVSCRNGDMVVLNAVRWATGVPHYGGRLQAYRQYVVNHEVGHALGLGHRTCPAPGAPAPVMLQQTYGLQGCRPNPWPTAG